MARHGSGCILVRFGHTVFMACPLCIDVGWRFKRVFASPAKHGKQPHWPSSIYRVYLKPVLENELKIKDPVGWHTLRHSLGTLMKANEEDVKTIQETLRHANFKATMDVYTKAVTEIKRSAHSRVVRQIMDVPEGWDEQ